MARGLAVDAARRAADNLDLEIVQIQHDIPSG